MQTRRLTASFEPVNSSLPLSAPELCARKATCNLVVLVRKSPKLAGRESVNYFVFRSNFWTQNLSKSSKVLRLRF